MTKISNYINIFNSLNNDFKEWFVGLCDAEGCFLIEHNKSKNSINLALSLKFHIDELPLLNYLNNELQCGKIYVDSKNSYCRFFIREFLAINYILIPIFQEFSLKTTKLLDCQDFIRVAKMIDSKEHLTEIRINQILKIKASMNTGRDDRSLPSNYNFNITWPWLLGFIEGDGSFSTNGFSPRFYIELTSSEQNLLLAIKNFLNAGNVSIKNIPKSRIGSNQKSMVSFNIQSIDYLYSNFIPQLDLLIFKSKKKFDYLDWVIIVKLNYFGYHTLPEGQKLIQSLKGRMNNNRLSTKLNSGNQEPPLREVEDIDKVFSIPSPYNVINGKRYKKT